MEYDRVKEANGIYDVVVIGAGINGAGIALDASLRGLKTLLIDKSDFGAYTTSASTKLIHGGLRYLEYLEFPLVRESLRERERLLNNAPHLVSPLLLNVPLYKNNKRGPLVIKIGMILYDLFSYDKSLPNHKFKFMNPRSADLPDNPLLKKTDLIGMASYYDCLAHFPERLCLELVLSAKEEGAEIRNYTLFTGLEQTSKEYNTVSCKDLLTDKQYKVKSKFVINATGPYVDELNHLIDKSIKRRMGGTKGSHIIINRFEGGPVDALYIESYQDKRPFFIIPWRDYYLVGTTDIYFNDDFEKVTASDNEIIYLLKELNYYFTKKNFSHDDILYSYSGVRPLPFEPGKKERQITRKHIIVDHSVENEKINNYISIVGGKITTYRSLSEETVDFICNKLNNKEKCKTRSYKLYGAKGIDKIDNAVTQADEFAKLYKLSKDTIEYLIKYYGSKFKDVLALTKENPELKERLSSENKDIKAQVVYALKNEEAKTLEDILIRRTGIGTSKTLGLDSVDEASKIVAEYLNWSENTRIENVEKYKNTVEYFYEIKNKNNIPLEVI